MWVVRFFAIGLGVACVGCSVDNSEYARDVFPLVEKKCANCHVGAYDSGELSLDNYAAVMKGGKSGPVVVPGDAESSLLYQVLADNRMPKRGAALSDEEKAVFRDWINAGAN